ncbi:MAG: STAS/SEC14 domain-containing protein [Nannocystaceae bacterium]
MIYYDKPFLTLSWDPDGNIVCARWKDEVSGEPMREGLETGLKLVTEKKAQRWLVDSTMLGSIDPVDVKWVNDIWMPRGVAAGLRWMAFVMAKKIVMQITMKSFIARINDRELANAYFDDVEAARAWLRAQS